VQEYRRDELGALELGVALFQADRTSFTGLDLRRIVEPGTVEVFVGRSAADLPCAGSFELTGAVRWATTGS
jgi:hypothetical protein